MNGGTGDRSRWIRRGLATAVLLAAAAGAALYLGRSHHGPAAGPTQRASAAPMEVGVETLAARSVPAQPRFLGQITASQEVEIRSRVRGFLLERAFVEGQRVERGQVLFRIDRQPFEIELASAKASLASAQARLAQATQQLKRFQDLFERGSVSPGELEEWQTARQVSEAQVAQETARIAQAELDLGYTTVAAPIAGVIGRTLKDAGTYVDDGNNSQLALLSQVDPIYVRFAVSEGETLRWRRLQREGRVSIPEVEKLELALELGDGTPHAQRGHIDFVDVRVDPGTGTTIVRGTVPNPEGLLKPGQFVHVSVLGIEFLETLLVPQRAVQQSPTGSTVLVVGAGGLAELRHVKLAEWQGDDWIVESGLAPGDVVIVDRLMQLRQGMPVVARPAAQTP